VVRPLLGDFCQSAATGVYAPLPSSIGPLRYISELSPATYVLRGVRSELIDGTGPDWGAVAILVVMACFFIPVGLWAFGRPEHYAKRTGKLRRVG
jgi:ABC-2 type transport system permease protein